MTYAPAERRPCKACQCPLMMVMGPNGKVIPLDLRSPVYFVKEDLYGAPLAEKAPATYVSHFCTCPKASVFTRTRGMLGETK